MHLVIKIKNNIILTTSYTYFYPSADESTLLINPFKTIVDHFGAPCKSGWNSTVHITTILAQIMEIEKLKKYITLVSELSKIVDFK